MEPFRIAGKDYEPMQVIEQAKRGAGWFGAIAAFSLVNSALLFMKTDVTFVIGLGATLLVDVFILAVRQDVTGPAAAVFSVVGILINLLIIGVFVLIWWLARRGSTTAYLIGMILYLLDVLKRLNTPFS